MKSGGFRQMLFDSHNHLQSGVFGKPVTEMVEEMRTVGISGCVANSTQEADWDAVSGLARDFPGFVLPAYGIHPWFADTAEVGWKSRLRERLEANPRASLGEIGIDGWVDSPSLEIQKNVFVAQVKIAVQLERVVSVHCLKAWDPLFKIIDEMDFWPEKFLMHSFGGSIEVAERLLKKGAWFSFSGYFLHERKHKVLEVFRKLPRNRILLETDAPDMLPPSQFVEFPMEENVNHPGNLRTIAEAFERELGDGALEDVMENSRCFWNL